MWARLALALVFNYISYLLTPKPKPPDPAKEIGGRPEVNEGDEIVFIAGTVWRDASQVAWWGHMKHTTIKAKSGKK